MTPAAHARDLIYNHNDRFLINVKCGRCSRTHTVYMLDLARRGGIVCQSCNCTTAFPEDALLFRILRCKQIMVHNKDERALVFGLYLSGQLPNRKEIIAIYRNANSLNRKLYIRRLYEPSGIGQNRR